MPESMIERVARALHQASLSERDFDDLRECRMREASAILAAMREPTDHMSVAGASIEMALDRTDMIVEECVEIWELMIDAALAEEG